MERTFMQQIKDRMILTGIGLIVLSALVFLFTDRLKTMPEESKFILFFFNYLLSVGYSIAVLSTKFKQHRWKLSQGKIEYTVLMLILWFISAFALNRAMNVFDESVTWLSALIIISCTALIVWIFNDILPAGLRHAVCFLLGLALLLFGYYSLYLVPLYIVSAPAALGLGISLHTYVPIYLAIITGVLSFKTIKRNPSLLYSFGLGIFVSILSVGIFIYHWNETKKAIIVSVNKNTLADGKLPNWAVVGQILPKNSVSERLMKADLVYKTVNTSDNWLFGGFLSRSFSEPMKHDPLVILASFFSGESHLDEKDRIKILETMYDSRHEAQERLWWGDKLQTTSIISNIKIFPEYRMAYSEKILTIHNSNDRQWNSTQEAIYTFQLPEGAVVSSLSLWIDGQEEKAYLTTKSKADSAYKEIVGVERRDPSVIHWQEGNTVSVRVFPCTTTEDRKFKIGVSSPLNKVGQELIYKNIYFDGPTATNASETLQISFSTKPTRFDLPKEIEEITEGTYQINRDYKPDWQVSCAATPLSNDAFTFNGKYYQVKHHQPKYKSFKPQIFYLDLNSSWTEEEFHALWNEIKKGTVYAFEDKLIQLTDNNKGDIFKRLNANNFSLFPVYIISDPENSLIISKSTATSPNFRDLKETEFAERTSSFLQKHHSIPLFCMGPELSPYLKTLKELRVFNFDSGSTETLLKLLKNGRYKELPEDSRTVILDEAEISISETATGNAGSAPDHLLRLFAYNQIMKKVAGDYFNDNFIKPDIIAEAEKANIVTPVSSLIVLETQKDYERFNIKESKNSLENASMKSSGAVPEPHEWLLILLIAFVIIYLLRKPFPIQQTR